MEVLIFLKKTEFFIYTYIWAYIHAYLHIPL